MSRKYQNLQTQKLYESRVKKTNAIWGMRHGRTVLDDTHRSDGWLDLPLSDEGRADIVDTFADHLKDVPLTRIYAPKLKRMMETAHIIQSGMPKKPEIVIADASGTWDLGTLVGEKKKPTRPVVRNLILHPDEKAPGGESYNQFTERFDSWFKGIQDEVEENGPVLLILSGSGDRRIGELLNDDRDSLDVEQAGLFVIEDGEARVICGLKEDHDEES